MSGDRPTIVFAFLVVCGGALFLARPEPNAAPTALRLMIIAVGVTGLAAMRMR